MQENIFIALECLRSNKMRSFLTMLGIIIGIAAVIAIMSMGDALSSSLTGEMQSMGTNNINVNVRAKGQEYQSNRTSPALTGNYKDKDLMSDAQIGEMLEAFPEIEAISISESAGSGQARQGKSYANVSIQAVNAGYATVNNQDVLQGRFIGDTDVDNVRSVCVVSDKLAESIFGGQDPIGETVSVYLNNEIKSYTVIGVYKYVETASFGGMGTSADNVSTSLYIPISVAKKTSVNKNYTGLTVKASQGADVTALTDELQAHLSRYYENNKDWEISVSNMQSMLDTVSSMLDTVSLVIAAIAGISLLVGGIGVMNIMMVSVTERTHEIGIRKALGAKNGHIMAQFVTEAILLALLGGLIGIILGLLLGAAGSTVLGASFTLSISTILIAVLFSMAIGVFFGYYPANKASKLNPIDALRYE